MGSCWLFGTSRPITSPTVTDLSKKTEVQHDSFHLAVVGGKVGNWRCDAYRSFCCGIGEM